MKKAAGFIVLPVSYTHLAHEKREYDHEEHQNRHQGFAPAEQLAREASLTLFIFGLLHYDFLHPKIAYKHTLYIIAAAGCIRKKNPKLYTQENTKNGEYRYSPFLCSVENQIFSAILAALPTRPRR